MLKICHTGSEKCSKTLQTHSRAQPPPNRTLLKAFSEWTKVQKGGSCHDALIEWSGFKGFSDSREDHRTGKAAHGGRATREIQSPSFQGLRHVVDSFNTIRQMRPKTNPEPCIQQNATTNHNTEHTSSLCHASLEPKESLNLGKKLATFSFPMLGGPWRYWSLNTHVGLLFEQADSRRAKSLGVNHLGRASGPYVNEFATKMTVYLVSHLLKYGEKTRSSTGSFFLTILGGLIGPGVCRNNDYECRVNSGNSEVWFNFEAKVGPSLGSRSDGCRIRKQFSVGEDNPEAAEEVVGWLICASERCYSRNPDRTLLELEAADDAKIHWKRDDAANVIESGAHSRCNKQRRMILRSKKRKICSQSSGRSSRDPCQSHPGNISPSKLHVPLEKLRDEFAGEKEQEH
ncbi:hypothetical protein C8R47DRAFT_1081698 [Mycena vitilis]|nr:hypothetical protein C8R47DRAFT_1081698 [Mycena vitilis]